MTTLNGVEFSKTGNPVEDLKNYATARGISESEAKEELEAEFGVAQQVNSSQDENNISVDGSNFDLSDTESLLEFLKGAIAKLSGNENTDKEEQKVTIDGEEFTLTGDPDTDAQTVADTLNITLDEAKEKLKEQLGDPSKPDSAEASTDTSETTSSTSTDSTDSTDDNDDSDSSSSSSSTMSAEKREAYYNLCDAEDKFKYAADNGWHNVQDLYAQEKKKKRRYEEAS